MVISPNVSIQLSKYKINKGFASEGPDLDIVIGHSWVRRIRVHTWKFVAVKSVFWSFFFCSLYFS